MAENLDNPSFGNFSIENTIEMGMGNADLLNDLMSPETATGSPDDIKKIDEPTPSVPEKKAAKGAPAPQEEKEEEKVDIQSFLYGDDEAEEEEDTDTKEVKKPTAPKAEESSEEEEGEEELPA